MLGVEPSDVVDRVKYQMLQANCFQRLFGEHDRHFASKGLIPFFRRTTCGSEQESTSLDEAAQIVAFLRKQSKLAFTVHDEHREIVNLVAR